MPWTRRPTGSRFPQIVTLRPTTRQRDDVDVMVEFKYVGARGNHIGQDRHGVATNMQGNRLSKHLALQRGNDPALVRQSHLTVNPRPDQSGRRITAAEHIGADRSQRPGIGYRIFAALSIKASTRARSSMSCIMTCWMPIKAQPMRTDTGRNRPRRTLVAQGVADVAQSLEHERKTSLGARFRRRNPIDIGGRQHARFPRARQRLAMTGERHSWPHSLGGHPGVRR